MVAKQTHHAVAGISRTPHLVYKEPIPWMRLLTTTAVFGIVTGAVLIGLESRQSSGPPTVDTPAAPAYDSPLGLKVISRKREVEIRWDHNSQAALNATKALVKISEGEMTESIPLDQHDLQDGFVAYTPMTNDVRVRFEMIKNDGTSVSESARIVAIP